MRLHILKFCIIFSLFMILDIFLNKNNETIQEDQNFDSRGHINKTLI
jgi:hypothetical protein